IGVTDRDGLSVSFIQSLYHELGSGVVVGETGVVWQNRGASFRLDPNHLLALRPGRKPFHTLNPAGARLKDGRSLVYGTMGGDGQPQTQAAIFTRYALFGENGQEAVAAACSGADGAAPRIRSSSSGASPLLSWTSSLHAGTTSSCCRISTKRSGTLVSSQNTRMECSKQLRTRALMGSLPDSET